MFKHILVPTDGSELSEKAIKQAVALARVLRARITLLHVVGEYHQLLADEGYAIPEIPELRKRFEEVERARAQKILDAARKMVTEGGVECDTIAGTSDTPSDMIIKQAEQSNCDLIMMASHGRRGLKGLLLGSETVRVLTHSTIPVLVCR
jgi:nucleotide-binding universal stress UspA family protein